MPKPSLSKIVPHLWYTKEAEEAARFYAAVFPDSHVDRVTSLPADSAIGPAGSVVIVDFTLFGQTFMAMSAGPNDPFNEAISFRVNCSSQSEVDNYWNALQKNGGKPQHAAAIRRRRAQHRHCARHHRRRNAGTLLVSFEKGRRSRFVSPAAVGRESRRTRRPRRICGWPPERCSAR